MDNPWALDQAHSWQQVKTIQFLD